jgi:hypothetical protein
MSKDTVPRKIEGKRQGEPAPLTMSITRTEAATLIAVLRGFQRGLSGSSVHDIIAKLNQRPLSYIEINSLCKRLAAKHNGRQL